LTTRARGALLTLSGVGLGLFYYFVYAAIGPGVQLRQEYDDRRQTFLAGFGLDSKDPGAFVKMEQVVRQDAVALQKFTKFAEDEDARRRAIRDQFNRPGGVPRGLWALGARLGTFRSPTHVARFADFWPAMVQVSILLGLGVYWGVWRRKGMENEATFRRAHARPAR
jgi:hypothetical protein